MDQSLFSHPMVKRKTICSLMGIGFGFFCAYLVSRNPDIGENFWWSALMWQIVFNRFLIGIFIFIAGAFTHSPLRWRFWPWFRGVMMGALVSLDMALGGLLGETSTDIFWAIIISGALYGLIIDVVATKFSAEGKPLIEV